MDTAFGLSKGGAVMPIVAETFDNRSWTLPDELLQGAIDSHVHAGPWLKHCPGRLDPFEAAEQAKAAGMRAIVLYDHEEGNSAGTAWLVSRRVPGIEVFGGLILTSGQGGLNPRAVKTALHYGSGAKFIHFGAHCTYAQVSKERRMVDGKPVFLKDLYPKFAEEELSRAIQIPLEDPIPPQLEEVLQLVADCPDVYLNTGHVSGPEAVRVVELANRFGIKKVVVAHVARRQLSVEQQKEAAGRGALLEAVASDWLGARLPRSNYYVEQEYIPDVIDMSRAGDGIGWAKQIREVGLKHFILASDYGVRTEVSQVDGMRILCSFLLELDFTPEEIHTMISVNPARLLGLT
jgi:hypothetical protein